MYDTEAVRCAVYRGGTSRGVMFLENDLPCDPDVRAQILLSVFGSPDPRQIDGIGGATSPTSKAMIIGPATGYDADVQMLFAQVSIKTPVVDYGGSCGNLTAAVGPFAVDRGLVRASEPFTKVRIYSINTRKYVHALVPTRHGRAVSGGDYAVPGVPGTGARIELEYMDPGGSFSGVLLPTGKPRDTIELEDRRRFTVSIVDAANPVVFCDARELGLTGTELPPELEARGDVMATLEEIRATVAEQIGIVADRRQATTSSPGFPKIGFVAAPAPYRTLDGVSLEAGHVDIVGRLLSMQTAHRSYMGTGAVCTAAAAMIEGTLVNELTGAARSEGKVRIGHPYGVMDVRVVAEAANGHVVIRSATIGRTARRILDGYAYVARERFIREPVA